MTARRRLAVAVAVVAGLVFGGGCSSVRGVNNMTRALEALGFTDVKVSFSTSGPEDELRVRVTPPSLEGGPEAQSNQAAGVVWTTFPLRFERLRMQLAGAGNGFVETLNHDQLTGRFGPREPRLEEKRLEEELEDVAMKTTGAVLVAAAVFIVLVTVTVVMLVRAKRRRALASTPPSPPVPAG